VSILLLLLL